jgi:hypothetical protein
LTTEELHAGLEGIRQSPKDEGVLELIVRRPRIGEREVLDEGQLDIADGLVGDTWSTRGSRRSKDGLAHPDMQLNIMNPRRLLWSRRTASGGISRAISCSWIWTSAGRICRRGRDSPSDQQ